jgi:hypothetical protein
MAKTIPFNIKIRIDGKDVVVSSRRDVERLGEALNASTQRANRFRDSMIKWSAISSTVGNVYSSLQNLTNIMGGYIAKANAATEAQTKLTTVMRQRMGATAEDVASVNAAVAAQTKLGVVGGTVQRSGLQQLATFASHKRTLTALLPAMNNLLTQQNGLNATSEDAVNIANLLGKALQGQTGALRRVGITFSETQEKALKAGNEGERAAMLAEIITQNVGNMNAELAKTDAGKAKQLANSFGGVMVNIGKALMPYQSMIAQFGQLGMAVTGVVQFGTALAGCGRAAAGAVTKLLKWGPVSQVVRQASVGMGAVLEVLIGKLRGVEVGATTTATAIRTLKVASVVGLALAALSAIIYGVSKTLEQSKQALSAEAVAKQTNKQLTEQLTERLKDAKEAVADNMAQLYKDIAVTKDWNGTKAQEKKKVEELNSRYGETMGYFSSVSEWYKALTENSQAYCDQLTIEATMRALANQAATNNLKLDDLKKKREKASTVQQTLAQQHPFLYAPIVAEGANPYAMHTRIKGTSEKEQIDAQIAAVRRANIEIQKQMEAYAKKGRAITFKVKGSPEPPTTTTTTTHTTPTTPTTPAPTVNDVVDEPEITDGILSIRQLDELVEKLYADLLALPDTKVKEALDIQDDIDTLEDYRKKLETLQRMRYERSGGLKADMGASGTIGGNVAGNTAQVDLAALVRPVLPSAEELEAKKKELQGVSGFDIIAKIDLRNNEADELRRQMETVAAAVDAGEIGREMGEMLADGINKQLAGIGKVPLRFGKILSNTDSVKERMDKAADAINQVGSALQGMGSAFELPELNIAGTIAQAIATTAMGFAQASANEGKKGNLWEWVAATAVGMAQLMAIISAVKGSTGYATGGIVGGNSYTGDRIPIRVNSGEMILNRWQQKRLWDVANGLGGVPQVGSVRPAIGAGSIAQATVHVSVSGRLVGQGRQLVAVIGNERKARGKAGWRLPWE